MRSAWAVLAVLTLLACEPREQSEPLASVPAIAPAINHSETPGIVEITLVATPGEVSLRADQLTPVLGYHDGDGVVQVPGPLIEAEVGDTLIVHFQNQLDEPTTVHWHGLRLPAEMDGNPMVSGAVPPGGSFEYEFELLDAGSYWYHPHVETDRQMELGLHGALIVRDPADPVVDGERVFFIDDVELAEDGTIVIEPSEHDVMLGRRGNVLLVNGRPPGGVELRPGAIERWRFINGANGRHLRLSLSGSSLRVIGKDGGLVASSYEVEELAIAPGERFDVLVSLDGETGDRFPLRTLAVDRGHEGLLDEELTLFWVELRGTAVDAGAPPEFSRSIAPIIADPASAPTREVRLSEDLDTAAGALFYINDQAWPLNAPIEVNLDDAEIWLVHNDSEGAHPFHIHGLFFEVLDVGGVPRPTRALEDTIGIGPNETARLAVRYTAPGDWMFHCQIPEHAERGMMGDLMVLP
jgi:FtsP/CotA-like multicopper oxidase with cupredoxin domain